MSRLNFIIARLYFILLQDYIVLCVSLNYKLLDYILQDYFIYYITRLTLIYFTNTFYYVTRLYFIILQGCYKTLFYNITMQIVFILLYYKTISIFALISRLYIGLFYCITWLLTGLHFYYFIRLYLNVLQD